MRDVDADPFPVWRKTAVTFFEAMFVAQRKNGTICGCKSLDDNGLQAAHLFKNGTICGTNFGTARDGVLYRQIEKRPGSASGLSHFHN